MKNKEYWHGKQPEETIPILTPKGSDKFLFMENKLTIGLCNQNEIGCINSEEFHDMDRYPDCEGEDYTDSDMISM